MTEQSITSTKQDTPIMTISMQWIVYGVVFIFVVLTRLLRLGDVPLTHAEVQHVLAAWPVVFRDVALALPSTSVLHQLGQIISFSLFGGTEIAARIPMALWGIGLVMSPLLFSDILGRSRTLITVFLLMVSPIVMGGSRLGDPIIITLVMMMLALWALKQYIQQAQMRWGVAAIVLFVVMALMTSTRGHIFLILHIAAFGLAAQLFALRDTDDAVDFGQFLRGLPWVYGISFSAFVVLIISTLFMLYPMGLNGVSYGFEVGLRGWFSSTDGNPAFSAFLSSLIYESPLWLLAIVGINMTLRNRKASFVDVFFVAWFVIAFIFSLVYANTMLSDAAWLTLPLIGLSSGVIDRLFQDYIPDWQSDTYPAPSWAIWVITAVAAFLLSLVLIHFGIFARALQALTVESGSLTGFGSVVPSLLILVVLILLLLFVSFTTATLYGAKITLNGIAIGFVFVMASALMGSSWQITWSRADNPAELWHVQAASSEDTLLLRSTLIELSKRETGGFYELPVVIVRGQQTLDELAMLTWIVRDFHNITWVSNVNEARAQTIIIAPPTAEPPEFGGNYVGQSFLISQSWDISRLALQDVSAWLYQRNTQIAPETKQSVILWLRQDIYNGVDFQAIP